MISKNDIKRIRRYHQKKYRDADGLFIVEGEKCVREALESKADIQSLYVSEGRDVRLTDSEESIEVQPIDAKSMSAISQQSTPSGVLAIVKCADNRLIQSELGTGLTLALDGVRDPGNMGTLIRIADWFGLDRILLSPDCVDIHNHKVVQSTMGGLFRVRIMIGELSSALLEAKSNGLPVMAAVMDGTPMGECTPAKSGVLVLGNESNGISEEILRIADTRLTIEGGGGAESLNVAIAGGVLAYWLKNGAR